MAQFKNADYKIEIMSEKTLGTKKLTTVRIVRKNKKMITPDRLRGIYDHVSAGLERKFQNKQPQTIVRGMSAKQMFSLKAFDDADINLQSVDEYFDGRVREKNDVKFASFFYVDIILKRNL
jgi:hypothetical protein